MGLIVKDNEYTDQALALIHQAKTCINISTFKVERTDKPRGRKIETIFQALLEKVKQGVKVRLLINWHDDKKSIAKTNLSAGNFLRSQGIEVRHLKNNRCCHAKIFSVDNEKALVGSHNLSVRSLESNFEVSFLLNEPECIAKLNSVFEHTWQDAKIF
jgi:cardiolipin synthase